METPPPSAAMSRSPVACHALERSSCDTCLWVQRGQRRLSVAVKGVFALVPDADMSLSAAEPLVANDVHHEDSPARSLKCAGEIVPYKACVDVTAVGHAYPPGGSATAMSVRLAIYRAQHALLDKTVHVFGDRAVDAHGTQGPPAAFERMALIYERALRGDANPGGVHADKVAPNLVHAKTPEGVGGFGPISRYAKSRRTLLAGADRKALDAAEAQLPDDFDGRYYQAAPNDQLLAELAGDEWIVLDGWSAHRARLSSRLPHARGQACIVAVTERAAQHLGQPLCDFQQVPLVADTLHIDADTGRVVVIWRGSVAIAQDAELDGLRVVGGVATTDAALTWPDPRSLAAHVPAEEPPAAQPDFDATGSMRRDASAKATPFDAPQSPWGPVVVKPIPQQLGAGKVTYADATGSTITLTPEERERAKHAMGPYAMAQPGPQFFDAPPGAPFEGTRPLSAAEAEQAARGAEAAPFDIAAPGESRAIEAPEGAPFAKRAAPSVPIPIATPFEVKASRFFHELPRREHAAPAQRDDVGPAIPKRTTDSIPIVCSDGVWLTTSPWQHRPPRDALTVIVKATYDIVPGGSVVRREDADGISGDLTHDDEPERSLRYPSDVAHFKPRADVVLVGHAYPPKGRGVATQVRFRFGEPGKPCFDRRVAVFGDRQYERALVSLAPTDPQPFERIPLVYERAFGGAGFEHNPIGRGLGGSVGPDGLAWLPNLEDPDDLITGTEDKPRPACLGPLSPQWPARWKNMGTFSVKWLEERWPYFPDDFDWAHHQCAPAPQQTDYLAGNEPFLVTGAHPEHTHVEGRLCGDKPRCFIVTTGDKVGAPGAELAFEEVKLNLDTTVFDMDAMTVNLVWRGIVEVSDELAPEIETFFLMLDPEGVETSNDDAYARLIAEVAPKKPVEETPELEPAPANDNVDQDAERTADEAERQRIDEDIAAHQTKVREELRAKGVDVDAVPPELPPLDPEQLAETLRNAGTSEKNISALLSALQQADEDDEPIEEPEPELSPRQRAEALLASGDTFDGVDLSDGDLSGLDFTGRSMQGCRLSRANLSGATLAGANLAAADLAEATLEGAVLDGAQLERTDFSQARATGASMRGVRGERCLLTGGTWTRASFEGAVLPRLDFTEASFDHAVFDDADLTRARLFDSRAQRASFKRTKLEDALCDSLDISGGNLFRVRGNGSNWEKANLADATVLECELDDANFMHASLMRANVSATSLVDARMTRMDATAAKFVKSNLMAANLKAAILRDADFTSANLYTAEVWKADLRGANLNLAITAMSKLHK